MLRWGYRGPDGTVDGGVAIPNHGKRPSMDIALYDAQKVSADAKAPQLADGASCHLISNAPAISIRSQKILPPIM